MTASTETISSLRQPTPIRARAEVTVRWIVAAVLLVAAALKADQIATEPMHGSGLLAWRPFWITLVEYEAMLGMLLLTGLWIRSVRAIATITFLGFGCFATYQALQGQPTCGCMGTAPISPWAIACMDAVLIAALSFTWPSNHASRSVGRRQFAFLAFGLLASALAIPTMLGFRPLALVHAPGLLADSDRYDFGTVKPSRPLQLVHQFRIENRSVQPVRILGSKSSCHCTVAKTPIEPIPPGGFTIIDVSADWSGRIGHQTEQITLATDSPTQPALLLTITANIVARAVYWPSVVDFGDVIEGQPASGTITLAPGAGQIPFRVISVDTDDKYVQLAQASDDRPSGKGLRWIARLLNPPPGARQTATVRFRLDLSDENELSVPITYNVLPAIRVVPKALLFQAGQEDVVRSISIMSLAEIGNLAVVSDELDPAIFKTRMLTSAKVSGGWSYTVEVRLSPTKLNHAATALLRIAGPSCSQQVPIAVLPLSQQEVP